MRDDDILALAGVAGMPAVSRAIGHARDHCEPYLFNHVIRSWLFAVRLGEIQGLTHDGEVTAVATILHDLTLNESFAGPRRFEVEGADLARAFVRELGFGERRSQLVWDAVALNSTPSIGLFKEPEVALCTAGICLDVVGLQFEVVPAERREAIVKAFPRLAMKRAMTRCFCRIAETQPQTTYDNFVRDFGERFVPGYRPQSTVDLLMAAPFSE